MLSRSTTFSTKLTQLPLKLGKLLRVNGILILDKLPLKCLFLILSEKFHIHFDSHFLLESLVCNEFIKSSFNSLIKVVSYSVSDHLRQCIFLTCDLFLNDIELILNISHVDFEFFQINLMVFVSCLTNILQV